MSDFPQRDPTAQLRRMVEEARRERIRQMILRLYGKSAVDERSRPLTLDDNEGIPTSWGRMKADYSRGAYGTGGGEEYDEDEYVDDWAAMEENPARVQKPTARQMALRSLTRGR